ncbi:MAG: nitrite/sulfite reductase [Lachnotalea sp.]
MEEQFELILEEKMQQQKELFQKEIIEFKEIGEKFIRGEISSNEFKASSGGMGVYAQRGGKEFMIRLRVLSGVLDITTLELINEFVNDYGLTDVHLTTREAIQLHNLKFEDVISIMTRSLQSNLFTRGGGGNFPRNVSLSPLSGVEREEAFDVTKYAMIVNKYFVSRMSQYKLPRKFKVAFSNDENDTANATIADLGFIGVRQEGKCYFKVYIGGGLGNQAAISVPFDELVQTQDVMYHVEASLRMLMEEGDYENKGKARMRFIVKRMGEEEFLACYKKILKSVKESNQLDLLIDNEYPAAEKAKLKNLKELQTDLILQKQDGLYTVIVHPKGGILMKEDLKQITLFLQKISNLQIRLSMEENMYIRNLTLEQAEKFLDLIRHFGRTTRLEQSVCCIGVPTCQIGIGESQKLLTNIVTYFKEKGLPNDVLPSIHISGCLNSCARHQVAEIGLQGKKKRIDDQVQEVYTLYIGGVTGEFDTHFATEYGDILADSVPSFIYELALSVKESQLDFVEYMNVFKEVFVLILAGYVK